jgi:transcriptional regulator with XRE-family HTH domain
MGDIDMQHIQRQPRRPHHIASWAEVRQMSQADIARELGADKSIVSRWFNGTTPGLPWQEKLAALFQMESPESLFRHPDDDWIANLFRRLRREEVERAKRMLEAAFPRTGTDG